LLVEICNIRGNYVRDDYGKEELRKGIANFTYKSCSGTICRFNDYEWKSFIPNAIDENHIETFSPV
jgi:hypothetical protein